MSKLCPVCGKQVIGYHKDKIYCSRKCINKARSDAKPRKTNKSYLNAIKLRGQHIPLIQEEIICGTLMGDACLILQPTNNFHRLSLCHSEKQYLYIDFKRKILNSIFITDKCSKYLRKDNKIQYHCSSISHKDLTNLYGIFYRNKKKFITYRTLQKLTPTSLLFWYIDDGSMIKSSGNAIIFCTDSFSLSEVKTIKQWFWQQHKIETNIMMAKGGFSEKYYPRLRFNKENTIKFMYLISNSVFFKELSKIMAYKFYPYFSN